MFKLCNLKPALATTFPVPDFSDQDMCEKINFAIDKSMFLSSDAEKNQIDMEEAGKGLDWVHSKEKIQGIFEAASRSKLRQEQGNIHGKPSRGPEA